MFQSQTEVYFTPSDGANILAHIDSWSIVYGGVQKGICDLTLTSTLQKFSS